MAIENMRIVDMHLFKRNGAPATFALPEFDS